MEDVVDKLIEEMEELRESTDFQQIMDITTETKFDDPGLVLMDEYPYIYVAPVSEDPKSETMGRAGYDVLILNIQIGVVINAADFFDPTVNELPGSRALVNASKLVRRRLRRLMKRSLDGLDGVRHVYVGSTNYVPDLRDNVFVRVAVTSVTVERQYQNED
jgi:hypothetical protein